MFSRPPRTGRPVRKMGRPLPDRLTLSILFSIILMFLNVGPCLALAPEDLIVVFNKQAPGSEDVALYYAQKRGIPRENLVGVKLPRAELISRNAFESIIPVLRDQALQLRNQGRTPSLLLVYGMPLKVAERPEEYYPREFRELVEGKIQELGRLIQIMVRDLNRLTGFEVLPPEQIYRPLSPDEILQQASDALYRAGKYLEQPGEKLSLDPKRLEIQSLIIQTLGTGPTAKSYADYLAAQKSRGLTPGRIDNLFQLHNLLDNEIKRQAFLGLRPEQALEGAVKVRFIGGVIGEFKFWVNIKTLFEKPLALAALDSELIGLLTGLYQEPAWLPNPFKTDFDQVPLIKTVREQFIMTARLDGPTPQIAKRLVDDALAVEQGGLTGIFYIDSRGLEPGGRPGSYSWFDQRLVNLAYIVRQNSEMEVVLDEKPELFQKGQCPDAALYCGWYSLGNYVDAFKWQKGAVGYHVASAEAKSLRPGGRPVWCKRMLEEGVAATLGPVAEPYLMSFPLPDEFFPLLMTGAKPLLEVYFQTLPHWSWRQVLVGDPLYNPFKNRPAIDPRARLNIQPPLLQLK